MRFSYAVLFLTGAVLLAQAPHKIVNSATARWTKERDGSESITVREDATATECLVRYPGGHVFRPHWHSVNERVVLIEGKLSLQQGDGAETTIDAGGYAFLPARQVQHTKCVSKTPCTFYVFWDGKLDFHPAL
jgi:quercetin dioxygenase-like cupin family protein